MRALRHGLAATALVVVVCGAVVAVSGVSYADAPTDRALSGLLYPIVVVALVVGYGAWLLVSRTSAFRRPARTVSVRRIRLQRGLVVRSWLETESAPWRWIPVYFDPVLVALPSPAVVTVYGDPGRDRVVGVEFGGVRLPVSGRVARREPLGNRVENPTEPDDTAASRAAVATRPAAQLRADVALLVPAPVVGAFWAFADGSGFAGWLAATLVTASLGLWWAAVRGSDPSA